MTGPDISIRWTPEALTTLEELDGGGHRQIVLDILAQVQIRLTQHPGTYRFVTITGLYGPKSRRLAQVQRYRYHRTDAVVVVLRIRHARQRPMEKP